MHESSYQNLHHLKITCSYMQASLVAIAGTCNRNMGSNAISANASRGDSLMEDLDLFLGRETGVGSLAQTRARSCDGGA